MKWIALYAGLAACAAGAAAMAEDAKPAMDPPAGNMTGTWRMIVSPVGGFATGVENIGQSPETCTFQQSGNMLNGTCKTVSLQGPISGTVSGDKVEWRWLYNAGNVGEVHAFDVAAFKAGLTSEGRIRGGFKTYQTFDKFKPSFDYKDDFKFRRPTNFTATKLAADPS